MTGPSFSRSKRPFFPIPSSCRSRGVPYGATPGQRRSRAHAQAVRIEDRPLEPACAPRLADALDGEAVEGRRDLAAALAHCELDLVGVRVAAGGDPPDGLAVVQDRLVAG